MIRISKFQRPRGYWYVRYWLGGRPIDESARTKSESAAEAYRVRREIEINTGIEPIRHAEIGELTDDYLQAMSPSATSNHKRVAERVLQTLLKLCGRKRREGVYRLQTQQISPATVDRFIQRRLTSKVFEGTERDRRGRRIVRSRRISHVTLKTELRYLSGFFNWCCRQRPRYLRENPIPLSNAANIKSDARPHYMITEEDLRSLLAVCGGPRQYLFILLGCLCEKAGVRHHRFHDFRISTSMKIKCGGFDASLAALWVGNQATTNRAHYTDLTAVATRIGSLLEVPGLPPVPWQNA